MTIMMSTTLNTRVQKHEEEFFPRQMSFPPQWQQLKFQHAESHIVGSMERDRLQTCNPLLAARDRPQIQTLGLNPTTVTN